MVQVVRIVVVAALLVGLSGAAPAVAEVFEARVECCADDAGLEHGDCGDEDESGCESDGCPPTCDDCVCRTVSVVIGLGRVDAAPVVAQELEPSRESSQAVSEPSLRGVFRPPRVA